MSINRKLESVDRTLSFHPSVFSCALPLNLDAELEMEIMSLALCGTTCRDAWYDWILISTKGRRLVALIVATSKSILSD